MVLVIKPKPLVVKEDDLILQQKTNAAEIVRAAEKEQAMIEEHRRLEDEKVIPDPNIKAPQLHGVLGGSYEERMAQERTIILKMTLDKRAEVFFTGFWNGKLISSAQNAIAREYRRRRLVATKQ